MIPRVHYTVSTRQLIFRSDFYLDVLEVQDVGTYDSGQRWITATWTNEPARVLRLFGRQPKVNEVRYVSTDGGYWVNVTDESFAGIAVKLFLDGRFEMHGVLRRDRFRRRSAAIKAAKEKQCTIE